jgi:hypothetical protein
MGLFFCQPFEALFSKSLNGLTGIYPDLSSAAIALSEIHTSKALTISILKAFGIQDVVPAPNIQAAHSEG